MKHLISLNKVAKTSFVWLFFVSVLIFSTHSLAINLDEAKTQGLVGETPSGYLEAVSSASPEVAKLIDAVNSKRRSEYQRIAKTNGVALSDVEALAGKKAIEKTPSGQFVKYSGQWRKK